MSDALLDDVTDAWLELEELIDAVELMALIALMALMALIAGLELLASLLVTILSDEEVCGLVLVLVLAVKPLPPAPVPPPPHALKSDIIVAATRVVILGNLKLLIGYYLLHATAIDEPGLRQLDP